MSRETKHTPGPWRVIIDDDGNPLSGRPSIQAADELDCCIVHWDGFVQDYFRSARGDREIDANARLIAAAPELLEAAQALITNMDDLDIFANEDQVGALKAAIAKATGDHQQ